MKKGILLVWLVLHGLLAGAQAPVAAPAASDWQLKFFEQPELALPLLVQAALDHSAQLQALHTQQSMGQEDLRVARKAILGMIQLGGSYGYGNVASATNGDPTLPTAYTTSASNRYAASVNLGLPLDKLLNRGNQLNKQRLQNQQLEQLTQAQADGLRQKIVELYHTVLLDHKILAIRQEFQVSAQMTYQLGEKQFRNGDITLVEMAQLNDRYAEAQAAKETAASHYATSFMLLEDQLDDSISNLMARRP
jgi:outer membrane protein TolC